MVYNFLTTPGVFADKNSITLYDFLNKKDIYHLSMMFEKLYLQTPQKK